MMDCITYRRSLMADPHASSAELEEHRASCPDCARFTEQLLGFEARLERALRVPLPAAPRVLAEVVPLRAARRPNWFAMAASVVIAVGVAAGLWVSTAGPSLAADVVTHMRGEPQAWRRTEEAVPAGALADVLLDAHMSLAPSAGVVSYASSCAFRGHQVPHLVIQTGAGPVTVMVLVHEHVMRKTPFDEQGYRGMIVPVAGHGDLAVLTRGAAPDPAAVAEIARRVRDSIVWH
jgi:hypothetical protein